MNEIIEINEINEDDEFEYNIEITNNAPKAEQPKKITTPLKPHQLACLYKAIKMEKEGYIKYDINYGNGNNRNPVETHPDDRKIKFETNIGIIGDIVGYGKTLTALSIIAAINTKDIHINTNTNISYNISDTYSYFNYTKKNRNIIYDNIIDSTLIIVPRGPVYVQWENTLKNHTTLKYIAIDNLNYIKKNLPPYTDVTSKIISDFFGQYDVVLIKNTTFDIFTRYYYSVEKPDTHNMPFINRWRRVMIDEAHDICAKIQQLYYHQLWLISATYQSIIYSLNTYNKLLSRFKQSLTGDIIELMLIKCEKEFVRNSFKIPSPVEKYYQCKLSAQITIIKNFISQSVLDKINANDIVGAIKELGGKSETENNIIDLVSKEIKKDINNKEKEREYVSMLDIPIENKNLRLKNIDNDIQMKKEKLADLTKRVSEFDNKLCGICIDIIDNPIVLECTHSYCAACLISWMKTKINNCDKKCPECRLLINSDKMIAIVKEKEEDNEPLENEIINPSNEPKILSKEETLLNIIKGNPNGKFLIFSKYDYSFYGIINLLHKNNITSSELKGNTSHMCNILESFKRGNIKVILLNTHFAGSGIDISYASDVIIFHSMGLDKQQAVGRAQRVGRDEYLTIHNLCYDHEMPR